MSEPLTTLDVPVAFGTASVVSDGDSVRIELPTDGARAAAHATTRVHRPALVRDALLAVGDVLASDLRFRGRDRADYLAYLLAKGKGVSKQVWDAQKEYLQLRYAEAARAEEPLDPVLTIGADALRLELLSRDESAYAQLAIGAGALVAADLAPGTTFLELSPAALRAIGRVRTYRTTTLALAPVAASTATATPTSRRVPLRWLRAFGQIQAAALLPAERFELAPIDLYNVLYALRTRKAKQAPRALRYELVPGKPPRIVLEPWDLVLTATGGPYTGTRPMVVRTWGRNRLQVLARLLPHARRVAVHLLGPGIPAFYVVDAGDVTLTLGLSGWTDAGWAGIATFDQLAVGADDGAADLGPRLAAGLPLAELTPATRSALAAELAGLRAGVDLARGVAFARPLLATPPPADALRYRDAREAAAHRLLAEPDQVALTKVHDLGADGERIEGQVDDARAHRRFLATFTIDREGRTAGATCTCPGFRRAGIKEGPCEHMIALRVLHVRAQAALAAARDTADGRRLIRAETRTLFRRTPAGSETFRLSLDDRAVVARWGAAEPLRMTRQLHPSADDARAAYFARLDELARKGFIDATA
ncbi:MAG: SWIM zinc finger family protein [Myxococcales bacterium]|nr:SWIM zinc finger family protein [Myxococcales bacterium]